MREEGEAWRGSEARKAWLRVATASPARHGEPELGRPSAPVAPFPKGKPTELSVHPNAQCHALVIAVASGFNTNERTSFQGRPNFLQGCAEGTQSGDGTPSSHPGSMDLGGIWLLEEQMFSGQ